MLEKCAEVFSDKARAGSLKGKQMEVFWRHFECQHIHQVELMASGNLDEDLQLRLSAFFIRIHIATIQTILFCKFGLRQIIAKT